MLCCVLIVLAKFCFLVSNSEFIEPKQEIDSQEIFQYGTDVEFIINNYALSWNQADYICTHTLNASLAYFESQDVIDFVAEYLGDSDISINTLWINLRKQSFEWKTWRNKKVDEGIFKCSHHARTNLCPECKENRNCGATVRMFHSKSCFVRLPCDAHRKFLCRRSIMETDRSSHLDWIKIGSKMFKIFYERLSYESAAEACAVHDVNANLAFVETYEEAQILGRFLLIGRPSKERAWIGARWDNDGYEFENEFVVLPNSTGSSGYPPWLRGKISKPFGCILLDRHLSNLTYFIESRCSRHQAYICYKRFETPSKLEVCSVGNYDWRIYYVAQNWFRASEICRNSHSTGRLPYIESQDLKNIIHIMETSKFDVLYHVWLGAYFENGIWTWTHNNLVLEKESTESFLPWVANKTYDLSIERHNNCLNLDREDSLEAMFYGTNCYYPQLFVCQYDKDSICSDTTISFTSTISLQLSTGSPLITTPSKATTVTTTSTTSTSAPTTSTSAPTTSTAAPTTSTSAPTTSTTTRTTTTTRKTTTKTISTKSHTEFFRTGSIYHTTQRFWHKSNPHAPRTTPSYRLKFYKAEPSSRNENYQNSKNSKKMLRLPITTFWPYDFKEHREDDDNVDYLVFN